jgi:FkbM family methyltransferase
VHNSWARVVVRTTIYACVAFFVACIVVATIRFSSKPEQEIVSSSVFSRSADVGPHRLSQALKGIPALESLTSSYVAQTKTRPAAFTQPRPLPSSSAVALPQGVQISSSRPIPSDTLVHPLAIQRHSVRPAPVTVNRYLALHLSKIKLDKAMESVHRPKRFASTATYVPADSDESGAPLLQANPSSKPPIPEQSDVSSPPVTTAPSASRAVPAARFPTPATIRTAPPRSSLLPTILVKSADVPTAPTCSDLAAIEGGKRFLAIKSYWELTCAQMRVLSALHAADPSRKGKIFFDVGANKGYITAELIALWVPEYSAVRRALGDYWRLLDVYTPCGACSECESSVDGSAFYSSDQAGSMGVSSDVRFFAIEAAPKTFEALVASPLVSNVPKGTVTVIHAVVSNAVQPSTSFRNCNVAFEGCSGGSDFDAVDVPLSTIDQLVAEYSLAEVFWLNIGTEGSDPLVLLGAAESLSAGRVSVVSFNYHGLLAW